MKNSTISFRIIAFSICFLLYISCVFALNISSVDAEKWKFKSKNGKTTVLAKGISTSKPLSNCFAAGTPVCLKAAGSIAGTNDLRTLMSKAKKSGEVKKWFFKGKKDAIILYIPKKKLLKCKIWKEYPNDAVVFVDDGMERIPAGNLQMGNAFNDGENDEVPVHDVNISDFYMDRYEVSNEKMREVLQWAFDNGKIAASSTTVQNTTGDVQELLKLEDPYCQIGYFSGVFTVDPGKDNYPCVDVTWYGACAYSNYKSVKEGLAPCYNLYNWSCNYSANGYRLPTEAEWEKAARGGQAGHRFPWGYGIEWISHDRANYLSFWAGGSPWYPYDHADKEGYHPTFSKGSFPYTNPVDYFEANAYGLHNMAGNVWEWCGDWYMADWYSQPGATQPDTLGPVTGTARVSRSCGWEEQADGTRCAARYYRGATYSSYTGGFRCARQ